MRQSQLHSQIDFMCSYRTKPIWQFPVWYRSSFLRLPSRIYGSRVAPGVGLTCDIARFPWLERCGNHTMDLRCQRIDLNQRDWCDSCYKDESINESDGFRLSREPRLCPDNPPPSRARANQCLRAPAPSLIVTIWLACTFSNLSISPLGQRISSLSTLAALPSPKCKRKSLWEM